MRKDGVGMNGTWYISKSYLGKPWPFQLAPGADGSLNPDLECQYCKDTSHLKEAESLAGTGAEEVRTK